ncbi:protein S100-A13-like [Spea bombifrons]|uniref:protein S100-A13-like n=1 Tax=Spea bombifrons TaxID=233779 RepID=UPI002348F118|nr:protein S100-A13-like [Spea bombifrons]XP_053309256.1 protein S100-A13-like [Spea bombifrons]
MAASHTEVEGAIVTVVRCFFEHAKAEGRRETLSFAEFTTLVTKELPHLMKDACLEEKMKELDIDKDNELKFNEYWRLLGELAKGVKEDVKGKK